MPHIVDKHSWALGSCEHAPLAEEDRTKEWLVPGSDPHKAVSNIVFEARRMKSLHYFSNFRFVKNHTLCCGCDCIILVFIKHPRYYLDDYSV